MSAMRDIPRAGRKVSRCYLRPRARADGQHPCAAVPAQPHLAQLGAAADGQAARTAGAGRVLGLLPRQLAAHPALPEGVARALRGRRPAGDRRPHRRLPALARRGGGAAAVERLGVELSRRDRRRSSRSGTPTATRAGRGATCGTRAARCSRCTTARAPTPETELEIQQLLGVEREPLAPLRPEDEPGVLLPAQTADQPGAYSGPYEAGAVWAVLEGAGELTVNGRALAVAALRLPPAGRAPPPHRGGARARRRPRPDLPHDVLHPGGRSSSCPRSPSSRMSRGGPPSSTRTAVPGQ